MKELRTVYRKITRLPPELRVLLALFGVTSIIALFSRFLRGGMRSPYFWWVVGGVVVSILLIVVVRALISGRLFRREKKFGSELAEQGEGPSRREVAEREAELRGRFKEGLQKLKQANISLYEMPWYLLLGEPGGGKTESLINSGMDFPLGKEEMSGFGGTRNYNWWFTNEAVILDTAGRLTFEQEGTTDRQEWSEFLRLLKKRRGRCPINGVIVAIPANRLMEDSFEESERKAGILRERLRQIQQALDVRFPIFVLVTKADLVPGFTEFFDEFDGLQRNQMFGWSRPGPFEAEYSTDSFGNDFDDLYQRLHDLRLKFLSRRADEQNLGWLYTYPEAFRALKPRLNGYIDTLFAPNRFAEPPFFRGFYFTSALQDGRPILDLLGEHMSDEELDDLKALFPDSRAFFIHDFYTGKVSPEQGMVFRSAKQIRRSRRLRKMTLFAGVPTLLVLTLLISLGSYVYLKAVHDIRAHVEYAEFMVDGTIPAQFAEQEPEPERKQKFSETYKEYRAEPKLLVHALYDDAAAMEDRSLVTSLVFPGGAKKLDASLHSVARILYGTQLLRPLVVKVEAALAGDYLEQEGASIHAFQSSLTEYLRWSKRVDDPKLLSLLNVLPKPPGRQDYTADETLFLRFLDHDTRGDYQDALAADDRNPERSERFKLLKKGIQQANDYWMKTTVLTASDPDVAQWMDLRTTCKAALDRYQSLLAHSAQLTQKKSPITSIEAYEDSFVKKWKGILASADAGRKNAAKPSGDQPDDNTKDESKKEAAQAALPPIFLDVQHKIDELNKKWADGVKTLDQVVADRKKKWGVFWEDLYLAAAPKPTVQLAAATAENLVTATVPSTKPAPKNTGMPRKREEVPDNPVLLAIFTARESLDKAIDKNLGVLVKQRDEYQKVMFEIKPVKVEGAGDKKIPLLAMTEDAGKVQNRIASLSSRLSVEAGEFDKEFPHIGQWIAQLKILANDIDAKAVSKELKLKQKDFWKEKQLTSLTGALEIAKLKYRRSVFLRSVFERLDKSSRDLPEAIEGKNPPPLGMAVYIQRAKEKSRRKILNREWLVRHIDPAFVKDAADKMVQLRTAVKAISDGSRLAIRLDPAKEARLRNQDVTDAIEDAFTIYICNDYVGSWSRWYSDYFLDDLYDVRDHMATWNGFTDYLIKDRRVVLKRLWDNYFVASDLLAGSINALLPVEGGGQEPQGQGEAISLATTRLFRSRVYEELRGTAYCRLLQAVQSGDVASGVRSTAKIAWGRFERVLDTLRGKPITIAELKKLSVVNGMPDILQEVKAAGGEGKVFEQHLTGQLQYVIDIAASLLEARVNDSLLALGSQWKVGEDLGYYYPFAKGRVRSDKTLADARKWLGQIVEVREALRMIVPGGGKKKNLEEILGKSDPRLAFIDSADAWQKFLGNQPGQGTLSYQLAIEFHPIEPGLQNIYRYITLELPGLRDSKGDRPVGDFQEEIVNIAKPTRKRLEGYWRPPESGGPIEIGIRDTILDTREEFQDLVKTDAKREGKLKQLDFALSEISPVKGQFGLFWFLTQADSARRLLGKKAVYSREIKVNVKEKSPDLFSKLEPSVRAKPSRGFEMRVEFIDRPGGIPQEIAVPQFEEVSPPKPPMGDVVAKRRSTTTGPAKRGRFDP